MSTLREHKKYKTKQRIYEHALNLFKQYGFEEVSVQSIAAASGIAKGTFFNYYPSKADVLAEWYENLITNIIDLPIDFNAPLPKIVINLVQQTLKNALVDESLWLAKTFYAQSNQSIQSAEAAADTALKTHLCALIEEQDKNSMREITAEALADLITTLVTGSVREWVVTGRKFDFDAVIERRINQLFQLAA